MSYPGPVAGGCVEMARMAAQAPPGCFVEVGVYKGGSALFLYEVAKLQGRDLYLFDTFTGIPYADEMDAHVVGDFGETSAADVQALMPEALVIEGVFPDSARGLPPVAFAHLDCDQYRAIKDSALFLSPLMAKGGVIYMDDPNCLQGAAQAATEVFGDRIEHHPETGKWFVRF